MPPKRGRLDTFLNYLTRDRDQRPYTLISNIGSGAFATVWSCHHKEKNRAAKIIDTHKLTKADQKLLKNEIQIWSELDHENTVQMYDVYHEPARCVIICELLEGGTLRERHKRMSRLGTKPRILTILNGIEQIAHGMTYIHSKGFIHRDIKSENILLTVDHETYKIADYGLARTVDGAEKTAETGSYRHMAPEVIRHEVYASPCDVYSFAMLLYEMLTLSEPFHQYTPVDAALAVATRGERPPLPPLPEQGLTQLIESCWSQSAPARPSFSEILAQIQTLKLKKNSFGSLQMSRLPIV